MKAILRRRSLFLVAAAAAVCWSAAQASDAKPYYREVPPTLLKTAPQNYEGHYVKVKDYFGRLLDMKERADRRIWRREWPKTEHISPKTHFPFFTQEDGPGSNMLCLIPLKNKDALKVVRDGLPEGQPIYLYGKVAKYEIGERQRDPDITYFFVDKLRLEHDEVQAPEKLTVSVGKTKATISRPGEYKLFCPFCRKQVCTVTFHKLTADFELKIKCSNPKCKRMVNFRFHSKSE